ncbi:MAG: hypothetical protein HQK96_11970 [Nitrospirae bacterium]|nr:hypothetical protein [Nitrospirota bacterium]
MKPVFGIKIGNCADDFCKINLNACEIIIVILSAIVKCSAYSLICLRKAVSAIKTTCTLADLAWLLVMVRQVCPECFVCLATAWSSRGRLVIASWCLVGLAMRTNKDHQLYTRATIREEEAKKVSFFIGAGFPQRLGR